MRTSATAFGFGAVCGWLNVRPYLNEQQDDRARTLPDVAEGEKADRDYDLDHLI